MHPLYSIRVSKVTNFASNAYSPDLDVMPNTVDNSIHPCLYTASQNWWTWTESNRRHSACKADVLPLNYRPVNGDLDRFRSDYLQRDKLALSRLSYKAIKLVRLVRLELTTSGF